MKNNLKYIYNADDFGISKGTNEAIEKAYKEGILNSTSIMVNAPFFADAVLRLPKLKGLNIGLHADFNQGFVSLMLESFLKPKEMQKRIEKELEAQIQKAKKSGIELSHLDSHRHVHMIPAIFKIFAKKAQAHNIKRVRFINENVFYSFWKDKNISFLFDGGLIKYAILRFFSFFNKYPTDVYFYSILYTCKIFNHDILVPSKYKAVEFGHHINLPNVDQEVIDEHVLSENRVKEFNSLMK